MSQQIGEFRCAFFVRDYEVSVAFYRDGLALQVIDTWDHGPDDRGTMFAAAVGIIEVLALPSEMAQDASWDYREPRGVTIAIEADDVDQWHHRILSQGLPLKQQLTDQPWGHRSFMVTDPDGLTLYIFSKAADESP